MCKKSTPTDILREYGMNVVRQPREGIAVLQFFERQGKALRPINVSLADLIDDVGAAGVDVTDGETVAPLSREITSGVVRKLALELLGNAYPDMRAEINTQYESAHHVFFRFDNVKRDSANLDQLAEALSAHAKASNFVEDIAKRGDLFVVSSLLKSAEISVQAVDSHNKKLAIDAHAVENAGGINLQNTGESKEEIRFSGDQPLVFAIETRRVEMKEGRLRLARAGDNHLVAYDLDGDDVNDEGQLVSSDLVISVPHEPHEH